MSSDASSSAESHDVASSHRRTAPPVVTVDEAAVADGSFGPLAGTITLLWTDGSEPGLLAEVERAVLVDDPEQSATATRRLGDALDRTRRRAAAADDTGDSVVVDVEYGGRTLTDGLRRADAEPVAAAAVRYNGGDLEKTSFRVRERGPSHALDDDYEYLVLAVPPVLDEGERHVSETLPESATASVAVGELTACPLVTALRAPVVTVYPVLPVRGAQQSDGRSGGTDLDDAIGENPSVEELLAARA